MRVTVFEGRERGEKGVSGVADFCGAQWCLCEDTDSLNTNGA